MGAIVLLTSSILWALLSAYLMMELSLFFSNSSPDRKPEESVNTNNSTLKMGNSTEINYSDVTTAGYDKNKEDAAKYTTCLVACHVMHVLCAICIAIVILLYDLSLFSKKFPSLLNLILLVFTIIFTITGCVLLSSLAYWYEPTSTEENLDKTNENFSFAFYGLMLYSIFAILLTLAATTLKTFQILYKRSKRPPRPKEVATPISSTPIPITAHEPDPKDLNPDQAPPTDTMGTAVEMDKPKTEHTNVTSKVKSTQRDSKIAKSKMEKKSERSVSGRMDAMLPTHVLRMQSSAKQLRTGQDFVHKQFVLVHRRKNSSRKSEKSKSRKTEKEKEKTEEEKRKSRKDSEKSRVKSDRSKDKKKDRNNNKATGKKREKGREKERKERSRSDKDKKVKNEEKSKPGKGKSRDDGRKKSSSKN